MGAQKQDDQLERTFSSYVRIQVVVLKTYLRRWTIGRSGERGSGISVLPARYDDDDDDDDDDTKTKQLIYSHTSKYFQVFPYDICLFSDDSFIIVHSKLFTSAISDGFSLEFEWQQVFSSLQDSSQNSGRPQQCCSLVSLPILQLPSPPVLLIIL